MNAGAFRFEIKNPEKVVIKCIQIISIVFSFIFSGLAYTSTAITLL